MDNCIVTYENEFTVAPKEEKPKKIKQYKYKVWTNLSGDRSRAMQAIFEEDNKAEFKPKDRWTFKVKTTLTLNDMNKIFMYKSYEYGFKKIRFF